MKIFECNECNNNSYFLSDIIKSMNIDYSKYKWIIFDLDLVPIFHGDYCGMGGEVPQSAAYKFLKKMEKDKIAVLSYSEMLMILEDTRTISKGVFICIKKEYGINTDTYCPGVESDRPEEMYDNRSEYEIRVWDGELFFILEKKKN